MKTIKQIFGWNTIDDLTQETWNSIHANLLYGDFCFAVKDAGYKVIISKRKDLQDTWMVGTMTPGWTSFQPRVTYQQLIPQITEDFKTFKFDKEVIKNFLELFNLK